MCIHHPLRLLVVSLLLPGLLFAPLVPPANAVMIETPTAALPAAAPLADDTRERLRDRLAHLGVDPARLDERLAALSEDEVARLAHRLERLPAGGDSLELLVLVFLVLLFTDILGFTDVYTFVKKPANR